MRLKKYFKDTELTKESVYGFFDSLRKKGNKNSSTNDYIKYLHHFAKILDLKWLADIKYLPEEEQLFDVLNPEEIRAIITIQPKRVRREERLNHFWPIVIETLLATGMRRQELCNLTWEDFRGDSMILRRTKNKQDRIAKISGELSKKILTLKTDNKYIFGSSTKLCAWLINRELQLRARLLCINKRITAHTLRRSSATEAASKGINLAYIQRFLGHKSVNTTSKYIQVDEAALQAVSRSLTVNEGTLKIEDVYERLKNVAQEFLPNFKVELKKTKLGVRLFIAD